MFEDLAGMIPGHLAPAFYRVALQDLAVSADIGFHAHEVGAPQRLLVTIEVWLDLSHLPQADHAEAAWDYDFLREEVTALAAGRRWNLQETLAAEIYRLIAARQGVRALTITLRKPDIYSDAAAVGITLASAPVRPHGPSAPITKA